MITPAEFLKWSQVFGLVSGGGGGGASVTPRQVQESAFNTNYASGVDDAFIVNLSPPPSDSDPADGMLLMMSSGSLSNYTTNPTIQLNDQPSQRVIRTVDGFVLPLDIQPDNTYLFVFSEAQSAWILINPSISNAQTSRVQQNLYNFTPDVGTPDNYIGSLFPDPPTNFSVGMAVYLLANNNNTGASTLTLNGITKDIRLQVAYEGSFDLQANMIQEDQLYIFLFDALTDSWVLVNPSLPYNLPLSGGTMAGDINTDGNKVTGLPLPIDASDAATKSYVDDKAAGNIAACNLATTGNLSGYVYNNGTAGVGATLTAGSNGALSVDGVTVVLGYRILVPNQTNEAENGVYEVTQVGDASNPAILTRATDYNEPIEIVAGSEARVVGGNTLAATTWMMTQTDVIIIGTTAITFIESSPSTNSFVTVSTNQTVTGLKTFTQPLDLVNPYMIVGTNRTDAANKVWRPQIPNYNLADGYFVPFFSSATSVQNTVSIGGGTSLGNAASVITFFSAPNITTPTGTQIADITYSGFRLGAGSRVNSISNDNTMAAASATNLYTGGATKTYIDNTTWKLVSSQLITGSVASVEFTNIGNYRMYWLVFHGVTTLVQANFSCRFSSDNGATWISSSNYDWQATSASALTVNTGPFTGADITLTATLPNSNVGVLGNMYIYNSKDTNKLTSFVAEIYQIYNTDRMLRDTRGLLNITEAHNAFQFYYPGTSMTSGRITLYGAF